MKLSTAAQHSFHIPVMGIAFTIDTPLKVGRFGIDSVMTITEDNLLEEMRRYFCEKHSLPYTQILQTEEDGRARRITAYLDLLQDLMDKQMETLRREPFGNNLDIDTCFQLLPKNAPLRILYERQCRLPAGLEKDKLQQQLRDSLAPGALDVNIMTKCDKPNYKKNGEQLPVLYNDAMAALRGFANSKVQSSIVFSAGMNPRLYGYCEQFPDFLPDAAGNFKKKITIKVSDYRSALIQGKFLAKKGLWVSEFRIESGLNCGGHAFATDGLLLGPALQEFKDKRAELEETLFALYRDALTQKEVPCPATPPYTRLTVQGGIGTHKEHAFLLEHYGFDKCGWGSPFLLVPEATNVDEQTLKDIIAARKEDFYLSDASPLGVPFHNFRKSSASAERAERVVKNRPGSPCYNKYLSSNTEFTDQPICTASRQYQAMKIKQINELEVPDTERAALIEKVTEKECICQGLGTAVYLKNEIPAPHKLKVVSICPGPNIAYFTGPFTLKQMVGHIYEGSEGMVVKSRQHMFLNEAVLYLDFLEKAARQGPATPKQEKYLQQFEENLEKGFAYYEDLLSEMTGASEDEKHQFRETLNGLQQRLADKTAWAGAAAEVNSLIEA